MTERDRKRLEAYERLLEVVDEQIGPLPSLVSVDPELVISLVEAHLTEHLPPDVYDARVNRAVERIWRATSAETPHAADCDMDEDCTCGVEAAKEER